MFVMKWIPGDNNHSVMSPEDNIDSLKKPGDNNNSPKRPGENNDSSWRPGAWRYLLLTMKIWTYGNRTDSDVKHGDIQIFHLNISK